MTETEWRTCEQPATMLAFLCDRLTERKWTLYLCAGLRQIGDRWLYSDKSQSAVEVAERMADGEATEKEIQDAGYFAESPTFGCDFSSSFIRQYHPNAEFSSDIRKLIAMGVLRESEITFPAPSRPSNDGDSDDEALFTEERLGDPVVVEQLQHAAHVAYHAIECCGRDHTLGHISVLKDWPGPWLLRDIFGNPFRLVAADPRWLTETAVGLARGIYDDRAFERLPILADALEEAGCDSAELLAHCREPGVHARGCWAVDLVLGKQ